MVLGRAGGIVSVNSDEVQGVKRPNSFSTAIGQITSLSSSFELNFVRIFLVWFAQLRLKILDCWQAAFNRSW